MPQIVVLPHETLCPEGAVLEVPKGTSVCDALLENEIEIEHACEKSCACTTCHVVVREGFDSLNEAEEREEKKRLAQEKEWEIPAFLRRVKFNK